MKPQSQPCHRRTLSQVSIGAAEICLCGSVHLSIGPVTLRLEPESLAELAVLLGDAVDALGVAAPRRCRTSQALS